RPGRPGYRRAPRRPGTTGRGERSRRFAAGGTGSRDVHGFEDAGDEVVRGDLLRLGLVAGDDAVAQDVRADGLHVFRQDVAPAAQVGVGAGAGRKIDRRPRRGAVLNERRDVREPVRLRLTRRVDEVHDVIRELLVHVEAS